MVCCLVQEATSFLTWQDSQNKGNEEDARIQGTCFNQKWEEKEIQGLLDNILKYVTHSFEVKYIN